MSIVCWCARTLSHATSIATHICANLSVDMTMRLQNACVELNFNMPRATLCQLPNAKCELRTTNSGDHGHRANVQTAYVPTNGRSLLVCLTPNSLLFDPMCTKLPLGSIAVQGKPSHFMPAPWPSYRVSCSCFSRGLLEQNSRKLSS